MTPTERTQAEMCKASPANATLYIAYVELVWGRKVTDEERLDLLGHKPITIAEVVERH